MAHLEEHVTTRAYNLDQKFGAPSCHPNTRTAVLEEIIDWIFIDILVRIQWLLWLNGTAGAGKSAIVQLILEHCLAAKIPFASFFFCHKDSTHNSIKPIAPTISHQLMCIIPRLEAMIRCRVYADPLIFSKSFETQFAYLIIDALRELKQQLNEIPTILFLLDGLDQYID